MTLGGWAIFGFVAIVVLLATIFISTDMTESGAAKALVIIAAVFIVGATLAGELWYFNSTESGKRAMKDQKSNFGGGITREVTIYDMEGDVIRQYEGKFDVEMHDTYVLFDDEQGLRHIVYFTTGTVAIDEK